MNRHGRDVLVAGGGPAGLAFALAAVHRGLKVTVLERSRPPVDKACGEGLMPDGVEALRELGVPVEGLGGRPFRGVCWIEGDLVAEGNFPGAPGLGLRRTRLHRALAERAEEVGLGLRWGTRVVGLGLTGGAVEVRTSAAGGSEDCLRASWLVGADGLHSRVRRWAGLEAGASPRRRFGVRRHFRVSPWSDRVEVYWADGCEAYVTPVGPREVGVAMLWDQARHPAESASFEALLGFFPDLAGHLQGAAETSRDRGAGPFLQRASSVRRGRVFLVGDAAGYVDALTGEGLSLAFHEARALAAALAAGEPGRYAARSRRLRRLPEGLTRLLLWVERHPRLRRRTLAAFAADGELFSRVLGIHARQRPPASLGAGGVGRLVLGLARGRRAGVAPSG